MQVVIRLNLRKVKLFLLFTVVSKYRLSLPIVEIINAVINNKNDNDDYYEDDDTYTG
jgi:hypothetical protein